MKILLVAAPTMDTYGGNLVPVGMDAKRVAPPFGIYLLATILRRQGHAVDILDLIAQGGGDVEDYLKGVVALPDLIGLGATSFSWPTVRRCVAGIRHIDKELPIALGGLHPTMFDQYVLRTTEASYVVRGEGELAMVELCEALEGHRPLADVTNLTYRKGKNEICRNEIFRTVVIQENPAPDYSQLPTGRYAGLSLESSRGCPFDCAFCSTLYRKTYRAVSPAKFVDHIETILPHLDKTDKKLVHIIDDEFSLNTRRATAIAQEIRRRELTPVLVFDSRATDILDQKFVTAIKPFVNRFLIGAESGHDQGLKKIGKNTSTKILEEAAGILHDHGISDRCDFSFVIGFPWETSEEVIRTVHFASNLMLKYGVNVLLQWYIQIPGSRLWDQQRLQGIVSEELYDEPGLFRNPYIFRSGVNLSTREFNTVSEIVTAVRMIHHLSRVASTSTMQYAHPLPIRTYFSECSSDLQTHTGLSSLRQVSASVRKPTPAS